MAYLSNEHVHQGVNSNFTTFQGVMPLYLSELSGQSLPNSWTNFNETLHTACLPYEPIHLGVDSRFDPISGSYAPLLSEWLTILLWLFSWRTCISSQSWFIQIENSLNLGKCLEEKSLIIQVIDCWHDQTVMVAVSVCWRFIQISWYEHFHLIYIRYIARTFYMQIMNDFNTIIWKKIIKIGNIPFHKYM